MGRPYFKHPGAMERGASHRLARTHRTVRQGQVCRTTYMRLLLSCLVSAMEKIAWRGAALDISKAGRILKRKLALMAEQADAHG